MISLYESILSNMEDTLERGDISIINKDINSENSKLRDFFNLHFSGKTPFNYIKNGKKSILEIVTDRNSAAAVKLHTGIKLNDVISDISNVIANTLIFIGENSTLNNKIFVSDLTCNHISIIGIETIENMDIVINDGKSSGAGFICDNCLKYINNCTFETYATTKDYASHRLQFRAIPVFNNVKSQTIQSINIVSQDFASGFAGVKVPFKKIDIWKNPLFNNIFEFGYSLDCTNTAKDTTKSATIKSLKDLKKLVVAGDFYSKVYSHNPYTVKTGAKISDFIDVSNFNNLHRITITDDKMGVFFINTHFEGPTSIGVFIPEILKQYGDTGNYSVNKMWDELPTTTDGWKVMIFRI